MVTSFAFDAQADNAHVGPVNSGLQNQPQLDERRSRQLR
jgi:hypothetical protein